MTSIFRSFLVASGIFAAFAAVQPATHAQGFGGAFSSLFSDDDDDKAPVDVSASVADIFLEKNIVTLLGDVVVEKKEHKITCNKMEVYLKKETEKAEEEKKTEDSAEKTKEEKAKEEKSAEESANKSEEKKKEEKKKTEETAKKQEEEKEKRELPPQYMPDGFTPYGNYVLVYDDGYEVKTRLSPAGLTYYYGSEEFLFTLNKDLPDMKNEIAHILFNNAAPMDPADTKGEEFPFGTPYMIYISLDDGSYYEVSSSWLDLDGRVFVRDIFELFRQKWEGAF